jgi:hypothetical protein
LLATGDHISSDANYLPEERIRPIVFLVWLFALSSFRDFVILLLQIAKGRKNEITKGDEKDQNRRLASFFGGK